MKLAIVYHMFPHYRLPVIRELDCSKINEYHFFGKDAAHEGILPIPRKEFRRFENATFKVWRGLFWQPKALQIAASKDFDGLIFLGNPNFVSTWLAAILCRLTGKKVIYWAHGWLKPEHGLKKLVRNTFYGLAHKVMVYGERAKVLGAESGFPVDRIEVIYNSLDTEAASRIVGDIENGKLEKVKPQALFDNPSWPLLICTARLTALCRFDLLFDAAASLSKRGMPMNILLVGDGPERQSLESAAKAKGLSVHFFGACYDEPTLGQMIYHADLTVSPGKIGLTAMHSLMYGTPAITHSDLDHQMPEVEAVVDGITGTFFKRDDAADLAYQIESWLGAGRSRPEVRKACWSVIAEKWNPSVQARLIEAVVAGAK